MKPFFLLLGVAAVLPAAAGPLVYDGFACPGFYEDGQPLAGVPAKDAGKAKDGAPGGGWQMDPKMPDQDPRAFLSGESLPTLPDDPKLAREEEAKIKDAEKSLDREERKKRQEKREKAAKGAQMTAAMKRVPGEMVLVGGQKANQSILLPLKEPLSPPFAFSFIVDIDYTTGAPVSIILEDEALDMPLSLTLRRPAEKSWLLMGGGAQGYLDCPFVSGPMFVVISVEEDPRDRDKWVIKGAVNPAEKKDPFAKAAAVVTLKATKTPKPPVRVRITKTGKIAGRIDEIRVGTDLRDVLP